MESAILNLNTLLKAFACLFWNPLKIQQYCMLYIELYIIFGQDLFRKFLKKQQNRK